MNFKARLVPKSNRAAVIRVQAAQTNYNLAKTKLAHAKTPAQKKAAENAIMAAQTRHHAAMGKLPIALQAVFRLKK